MADRVRSHSRRTPSGGTTRVRQHSRAGRPRHPVLSPAHAWQLLKRSWRAGRRRKRVLAVTLGVTAVGEMGAWLAVRGLVFLLLTAGTLALLTAGAMNSATSKRDL